MKLGVRVCQIAKGKNVERQDPGELLQFRGQGWRAGRGLRSWENSNVEKEDNASLCCREVEADEDKDSWVLEIRGTLMTCKREG